MKNIVELAREIATKAHAGQTRWGGEPYITHPEAVAREVAHLGEVYEAVALLHDSAEDNPEITPQKLFEEGIPNEIVQAVIVLTHRKDESYLNYILRIKGHPIATPVKIADIRHNLASLGQFKGKSQRDKYELALWILLFAHPLSVDPRGQVDSQVLDYNE
jgi:(p)ppGpp synthase/HD superfamily hydrolase